MVASDLEALVWGVAAALFGAATAYYGAAQLRDWWALRGAGADPLHEAAAGGPVVLEGTARPVDGPTSAPFTGRDCVAYDVEIEAYRFDDDGSNWHTVHTEAAAEPFLLSTDGGEALVAADADGFELDVADRRERFEVDDDEDPPADVREYVADADVDAGGGVTLATPVGELSFGGRHRYTEHVLAAGETAAVSGVARAPGAVDREVPRAASVVVVPGGDLPDGRPAMVADASLAETTGRELRRGVGGLLLGALLLAGAWAFLFL